MHKYISTKGNKNKSVAAGLNDNAGHKSVLQLQDNRPLSIAQRKVKQTIQMKSASNDVVQRLIVIPQSQLDPGMIINVWQMLRNGIDSRVTLFNLLQLNDDRMAEPLHMMGHGYGATGNYANMAAADLAAALIKAGLKPNMTVIKLLSCNSGVGDGGSYAAELATQLNHVVDVQGHRGLGVTMDTGISYAKRSRTVTEQAEYDTIFAQGNAQWLSAVAFSATARAQLAAAKNEQEVKEIFLIEGPKIYALVKDLFEKLYEHQKKLLLSPSTGTFIEQSPHSIRMERRIAEDSHSARSMNFGWRY